MQFSFLFFFFFSRNFSAKIIINHLASVAPTFLTSIAGRPWDSLHPLQLSGGDKEQVRALGAALWAPQHQPLPQSRADQQALVLRKAEMATLNKALVTFAAVCTSTQKSKQASAPD